MNSVSMQPRIEYIPCPPHRLTAASTAPKPLPPQPPHHCHHHHLNASLNKTSPLPPLPPHHCPFHLLTNDNEGNLLRPKLDVKLKTEVIDGDFEASRNRIDSTHSVKHDVDRRYEDLPHAIEGEEVTERVKVYPLESLRVDDPFLMVAEVV